MIVVERFGDLYGLPRAIRFDGEVMRIFQRLGIAEEIREEICAADRYSWYGADGGLILDIDATAQHPSGWRQSYAFFQPAVERVLDQAVRERFGAAVRRLCSCEGIRQHDDHVELQLSSGVLRARYVVGADGANSLVREACGIAREDLGFDECWLVADVRPHDMARVEHLPVAAQYCDPRRPHVAVRNGARHRRWEFMLLPGEQAGDFDDPARVWKLLAPYMAPEDGTLVRKAVYEFRSLHAQTMRDRRVLLAGDAAHLMPPFMGEGLCSGLRDANNLAWRLNHILRGVADDGLLSSYTPERRHQNEAMIRTSVEMGRVSCTLDPDAAAARHAALRSGAVPPPPPVPGIGPGGVVHDADSPLTGRLAVQGRIEHGGRTGLLDEVLQPRWVVVCAGGDPRRVLGEHRLRSLADGLRAAVVSLEEVRDVDGALSAWLAGAGAAAVISRPDGYVFGAAAQLADLPPLVDDLRAQLATHAAVSA